MAGFMIILSDALPDLDGGSSHDRIQIGIVVGIAAKHLSPQRPLLYVARMAFQ
jgi:hypothetical protein